MKKENIYISFRFILLAVLLSIGSCSNRLNKPIILSTKIKAEHEVKPPVYLPGKPVYIHDTITRDIRHMTPEQYKAYLREVYREGIDSLVSPQFKNMANSNKTLTALIRSMFNQDVQLRVRTRRFRDSINQRSDFATTIAKRAVDSANKVANDRQTKIFELTTNTAAAAWDIVKILFALTVIIVGVLLFVYLKVSKLGRKVEALEKTFLSNE